MSLSEKVAAAAAAAAKAAEAAGATKAKPYATPADSWQVCLSGRKLGLATICIPFLRSCRLSTLL